MQPPAGLTEKEQLLWQLGFNAGRETEREDCAKLADLAATLDRSKGELFATMVDDDTAQSYEDFAVTAESIARSIRFRSNLKRRPEA